MSKKSKKNRLLRERAASEASYLAANLGSDKWLEKDRVINLASEIERYIRSGRKSAVLKLADKKQA